MIKAQFSQAKKKEEGGTIPIRECFIQQKMNKQDTIYIGFKWPQKNEKKPDSIQVSNKLNGLISSRLSF